eukprot:scaffold584450_cov59-Attheya_sp.AAC.2
MAGRNRCRRCTTLVSDLFTIADKSLNSVLLNKGRTWTPSWPLSVASRCVSILDYINLKYRTRFISDKLLACFILCDPGVIPREKISATDVG